MRIAQALTTPGRHFSCEIFPPKGDLSIDSLREIISQLQQLHPDFISVTCSAGGTGDSSRTAELAGMIKKDYRIESCAHLTCINSTRASVEQMIERLRQQQLKNVLALRGDRVEGAHSSDFLYAKQLIPLLKAAGFCVGAACYPEGHIECDDLQADICHLKEKQEAGADFFISQLFFDNNSYFDFVERAAQAGVDRPLLAGIMPIMSKAQIQRMIFLCGASLPSGVIRLLNRYENDPASLLQAGIEYAAGQINGLLQQGVANIHLYVMNKPDIARQLLKMID